MNDRQLLLLAQTVCTPRQLQALELKIAGYGLKRSARILAISPQAVSSRLHGAELRIRARQHHA